MASAIQVRASRGRFRRAGRSIRRVAAFSIARFKEKQQSKHLLLGGAGAVGFGLVQRNVELPGIKGVPNSLTYGAAGVAAGVLMRSDALVKVSTGPFFAGLHNIAKAFPKAETVSGEYDRTEGEFDREEVGAGDFDDV